MPGAAVHAVTSSWVLVDILYANLRDSRTFKTQEMPVQNDYTVCMIECFRFGCSERKRACRTEQLER